MVREVAPNLSYHYWALGVRGQEMTEEADPLVIVRGSEFQHGREIEMQDDEGHMGTATTKISTYRSKASATPSFTDKLRYKEGWEDIWLLLLGSKDGNGNIRKHQITAPSTVPTMYEYTFKVNVDNPQEPYFCTLVNGFAKTETDAYRYEDCLLSEFELSGSNEEAPTYTVTFASNYPKFNQQNPATTFPAKSVFPKNADVRIYIAPQLGDGLTYVLGEPADATQVSIDQYEYPCYIDWSLSVNNNIESVPCSGDEFGESTKVLGNREGTVNVTIPWTSATKHLEYVFEGGDADASMVTTENDVKTVWIVIEGQPILYLKNDEYIPSLHNYTTVIKVPQVVMTSVVSEQSGSDAKQIALEGNIEESSTDSFITAIVTTDLQALHIDTTVGHTDSLYEHLRNVTFTVTDGTDPLQNAKVTVVNSNKTLTTDANGQVTFNDVPDGKYEIQVKKSGYQTSTTNKTINATHTSYTIALESNQ